MDRAIDQSIDAAALARLRAETPACQNFCHFNNAGASLMPQPVLAAIREHLELEAQIGGYEAAELRAAEIQASYAAVAELLGTEAQQIAMVENATAAFALALSAIPWTPGDVLLTTRNDYVSNQLMYLSLAKRLKITVERAPDTAAGGVDVDAMVKLMRERRPKLVAVTHIPTSSGLIQPVAAIGQWCRQLDLLYLVDACQSLGQLPLDVTAIGCDFLSATARKFLRGPRGAGLLYVAPRALAAGYEPLFPDLRGAEWQTADTYVPAPTAQRFENWEFAYALVLGTGAAARYACTVGLARIAARNRELIAMIRRRLAEVPGIRILDRGSELGAIITLHLPGCQPQGLKAELRQRRINVSVTDYSSAVIDFTDKRVPWALRISPHYFNTEDEIEQLAAALTELSQV